jgi:dephospho-CoA kinase
VGRVFVIGLTGGLGTGKSTVAEMLREKGAVVIQADQLGHQVYEPGRPAYYEIVAAFGPQMLGDGGRIDRRRLAQLVFADAEALARLNRITHPRIRQAMQEQLAQLARQEGVQVAVVEAALLLEAGWDDLVDEIWVTVAPPEVAAQRAAARSGIPVEEAMARIRAQLDNEKRAQRAHVVIDTSCPLEETRRQVEEEWQKLTARLTGRER